MKLEFGKVRFWALWTGYFMALALSAKALEAERGERPEQLIHRSEMVVIGQNVVLRPNEVCNEMVVISGSARIEGTVQGDVVVVAGSAEVEGTISGDLVVILGGARLGPKAAVRRDVTVIAGSLETKPTATIGGKPVVLSLGTQWLGMNWFKEWLSSGLLWARPLAPGLVWIWIWTGICLAFYLLLALIFPRPLRACVSTLENRPVAAIFSGLLAFLLIGPLMLLLVISIIGVAAIPFLTCGLIMAFVFGKIALYQFTGEQIALQTGVAGLRHPLVALIVGMAVFCLLYIIPVLGFVVWGLAAPLGLGAAVLAFAGNFRREPARLAASTASPPSEPKPPVMSAKPAAEPVPGELALNPRAGFWIRLWATLLDLLLVGVLVTLFNLNRFALLAWTVYLVVMWGWKGTTIGGSVFGLKVIRTDGRPLGFEVAVVRSLAGFLSAFPFFLGFMWAGWDKESQSWHDKIAGTLIVKMPKGVALL